MDAYTNLLERRSCRAYTDEMPSEELIGRVVKAGTYAATGMGKQSPVIIAVTNRTMRDRLSAMNAAVMGANSDPFYGAPVVLIVLADRSIPTYLYDGSCVMQQLMLAAHEAGLGSCWIHRAREEFNTDEGRQILKDLGIEGDYEGIGHCVLGFAAGKDRKPLPRKENYVYWIR
ncbi:MAG: nitroreductase [Clostridia bacterium]|nr:nitroreductase [Clostridia bacterium]